MNIPNMHISKSVIGLIIVATAALHFFVLPWMRQSLPVIGDVRLEKVEKESDRITIYASGIKKRNCTIIAHQPMVNKGDTEGYKYRPHYNFKFDDSKEPIMRQPSFFNRQFFHPWVFKFEIKADVAKVEEVLLLTRHICSSDNEVTGAVVESVFGPFQVN